MGTRNLTAVMIDGTYRVAQYSQWDGFPSGQGAVALEFCRKRLATPEGRERFETAVRTNAKFITEDESEKLWEECGAVGGMASMDASETFKKKYPSLHRDAGAEILEMVYRAEKPVPLTDSISFASDSLFCEYAYVVDLDKETFEVYKGFNKRALGEKQRFASFEKNKRADGTESEYFPIRHVKTYLLDSLPTEKEFLAELEPKDEE